MGKGRCRTQNITTVQMGAGMPFSKLKEQTQGGAYETEVSVCCHAAQAMRACGADLGLDHPWRDRFDELAALFEADAVLVAGLPEPQGSEAVTILRLVD
jgi:hypothetical protein